MSRSMFATAFLCSVALAPAVRAQHPMPMAAPRDSMHHDMPGMKGMKGMEGMEGMKGMKGMKGMEGMHGMGSGGPGMPQMKGGVASMLLSQTAALKLTDQQVTRLAALARSAEMQQVAMHAAMDSTHRAMMANRGAASAPPMTMTPDMEARMKAAHEAMHVNTRDALAVLTADQLATVWEQNHPMGGMRMTREVREMRGGPEHMMQMEPKRKP